MTLILRVIIAIQLCELGDSASNFLKKTFGGRTTSGVFVLVNKLNVYHIEIL